MVSLCTEVLDDLRAYRKRPVAWTGLIEMNLYSKLSYLLLTSPWEIRQIFRKHEISTLRKKWCFPLRISSVNVTKSAVAYCCILLEYFFSKSTSVISTFKSKKEHFHIAETNFKYGLLYIIIICVCKIFSVSDLILGKIARERSKSLLLYEVPSPF